MNPICEAKSCRFSKEESGNRTIVSASRSNLTNFKPLPAVDFACFTSFSSFLNSSDPGVS